MTIFPLRRRRMNAAGLLTLLLVSAAAAASCGKKGPPLAPLLRIPAAADRVVARRLADTVYVEVTIPARNQDNSTPADVARVEVYGFTGTPRSDDELLQRGTLVATVPVRKPASPEDEDRPNPARESPERAKAAPQAEPGFDRGVTVTVTETLTPALMKPMASPTPAAGTQAQSAAPASSAKGTPSSARPTSAVAGDAQATGPSRGPTEKTVAPPLLTRVYVAVAVNHRGRRGAVSRRAAVPIEGQPAPPGNPSAVYNESQVVLSWTPPASAAAAAPSVVESPSAENAATAQGQGNDKTAPRSESVAYNVYAVAPPSAQSARPAAFSRGTVSGAPAPLTEKPVAATQYSEPVMFDVERCYAVRTVTTVQELQQESAASPVVCLTPKDHFPPSAPKGLTAVTSAGAISLLWEPNGENDLAGYLVLRGEAAEAVKLQPLTPQPIAETTYTDTTVVAGTRYVYAVVAVDKAGNVGAQSGRVEETAQRIP